MLPLEGSSFDPAAIPKAVRAAGFTAVDLEITVVGTVSRQDDLVVLDLPEGGGRWILAGGERLTDLETALPELRRPVRVRGRLHPAHGDDPAGMTVEDWQKAGSEP